MKEILEQAAERSRGLLQGLDCDFCEIRIASSETSSIVLSGRDVDSISSGTTISGSVRLLKDGAWGFTAFNDLGRIDMYARKAMEIARSAVTDRRVCVLHTRSLNRSYATPAVRDFRGVSTEEKFSLLRGYNEILMSSKSVQSTRAVYRDSCREYLYLDSDGSCCRDDSLYCGISLTSVSRDGSVIQPFQDSVSGYGGFEIVVNRDAMAERVVKTSGDLLKAESAPGGKHTVVVDQKLAGVFIHEAFGHLSEADFVYENGDMRAQMVIGKEFGPPFLNVFDDGSMEGLGGYIPFDDEGVQSGKTALITRGVLTGRLHSRETAGLMDENLTGNARAIGVMRQPLVRMTNTFIDNGPHSYEEIMEGAGKGLYVAGSIGGMTNLEMFTFTADHGYEIKNGKKGKLYRDIMLSGNVFTTLKNIKMIANDRKMFSDLGGCGKGGQGPLPVSLGGPHILITNVVIGGQS